jgi:hypothetical protein
VRIHLAGKHAGEFEFPDRALERTEVLLNRSERSCVALRFGELDQSRRVPEPARQMIERGDGLVEPGALTPELLCLVGRAPDRWILELAPDFVEALLLVVVFKGTS